MRATILLGFLLTLPAASYGQETIEVTGVLTGDVTWTNNNTYLLISRVFVDDGATLTIEPGTVIKGRFNADPNEAAALIVAQGGKIFAEGTSSQPVIFTAEDDDLSDPSDLGFDDRALWGGVIILGRARTNTATGTGQIEGIPETEPRGLYGGDDDADDSGVFRYVSIRHGGANIAPNNEINGLTLGAVGTGTTIEFVEVFANEDDGYEWFGGTVNTRYLVSAFCGDDGFDYDEGFRGKGQFWFGIQASDAAGSGGEFDGGTTPEDGQPYAMPVVYNITLIGSGAATGPGSNDFAMNIRDNAGGQFYNSIFTDFVGRAIHVEDLASGEDSWARLQAGELRFENNLFWGFGAGEAPEDLFRAVTSSGQTTDASPAFVQYVTDNSNQVVDPMLTSISRVPDGGLDPRPLDGSPALSGATAPPNDGFYVAVDYLGAFGSSLWVTGWTALHEYGFVADVGTAIDQIDELPGSITLEQNFPNPFNPSTSVEFRLDRPQEVHLAVYDLMGRQVAVLANGGFAAGTYRAQFDAHDLASGLYLYRLQTETEALTKSMLLLK